MAKIKYQLVIDQIATVTVFKTEYLVTRILCWKHSQVSRTSIFSKSRQNQHFKYLCLLPCRSH